MKKMKTYWIVGVVVFIALIILSFMMFNDIFKLLAEILNEGSELTTEHINTVTNKILTVYYLPITLLTLLNSVFGIFQLIYYAKGDLDTSKTASALYQLFFGIGLIGLIIALVIKPNTDNRVIDN